MQAKVQGRSKRYSFFAASLVVVTILLTYLALVLPLLSRLHAPGLHEGDVATQDYNAPRSFSYISEVLTAQRQNAAERSVATVYSAPNTSISRQQLESLQGALAYINSVRGDKYASGDQKVDDLAALEDIRLSLTTAQGVLGLSDARWQVVQQEAINVLEETMRTAIRPDRLEESRGLATNLVSLSIPEEQAAIVAELAAGFVAANSLPSETLTEAARQKAREAVEPASRTFLAGQTVVSRGQVLSAADVEALNELGLGTPTTQWQDLVSPAILTLLIIALAAFSMRQINPQVFEPRSLALVTLLSLAFLFGARMTIPGHTLIPYAYPIAGFSLVIAAIFGPELALAAALPLSLLAAYDMESGLELTLYYSLGSLFGVLGLGKARRVLSFFRAALAIFIASACVVWIYRLPLPSTDTAGLLSLTAAAAFTGLASGSLALVLQFFAAQVMGMTTPMQLMELSRPDNLLLQSLLRDSAGTYQHSLQVANLAEQAAERIGADPLLVRVGALYHDVGKTLNPVFFIENQMTGMLNPHDDLDPLTSAQTIIRHVTDGLTLGRKYHLPRRILDFISEHHGTMITRYQYIKAVNAAGGDESKVDIEGFRYPGPRPQSLETAILMLADGCEARVRAEKPKDEEELEQLVKSLIDNRVAIGELDDTRITLQDINQIADSFTTTLRGVYHPRVKYPTLETPQNSELPTRPLPSRENSTVEGAHVPSSTDPDARPS